MRLAHLIAVLKQRPAWKAKPSDDMVRLIADVVTLTRPLMHEEDRGARTAMASHVALRLRHCKVGHPSWFFFKSSHAIHGLELEAIARDLIEWAARTPLSRPHDANSNSYGIFVIETAEALDFALYNASRFLDFQKWEAEMNTSFPFSGPQEWKP